MRFLILVLATAVLNAAERPHVGVALGGGGALGLAHVGVLLWMERNHIPVDVIAGTSMGAMVGGSYASGMTARELDKWVRGIDWNEAFRGTAPYADLRFRRKEDKRAFPNRFELGLKHGVQTQSALSSGFALTLLLDRMFVGIPSNQSFDKMPTPFRCIATDLVTGDRVEISDGSVAEALRASSSIPGVFAPVRRRGQVLVDGGILDNLPVDSARGMGADIVIASLLPTPPMKGEDIQGFGVVGRAVTVSILQNERQSMKKAQVVIVPDVANFSSSDYLQYDALIKKGVEAAEAQKAKLLPYALNDADWADFVKARESKRRELLPSFQHIEVSGGSRLEDRGVDRELAKVVDPGKKLDPDKVEKVLTEEYGTARYTSADYSGRFESETERTLHVKLAEKLHGPPFVFVNTEVRGEDSGRTDLTVNSRFLFMDVGGQNAEVRADLSVGSHTVAAVEYYHRFGRTRFFWAPRAAFDRKRENYYSAGHPAGDFDLLQGGAGFDVGYTGALFDEVRLGVDYSRIGLSTQTGVVPQSNQDGVFKALKLQYTHDGQNSEQVPSRGLRFSGTGRYVVSSPLTAGFPLLQFDSSWFHPLNDGDRVFVRFNGGSSFGHPLPLPLQFTLGGPLRLGAYGLDEFRGDRIGFASVGYLRRIGRLPAVLGGALYLGGWIEGGGFSAPGQGGWRQDGTVAFVAETPLGPFYTGWSLGHSGDQWKGKFTFLVGRFF